MCNRNEQLRYGRQLPALDVQLDARRFGYLPLRPELAACLSCTLHASVLNMAAGAWAHFGCDHGIRLCRAVMENRLRVVHCQERPGWQPIILFPACVLWFKPKPLHLFRGKGRALAPAAALLEMQLHFVERRAWTHA